MLFDELESILARLVSFPLKDQIKVDFDRVNKLFRLSVPIYNYGKSIPSSVQKYVAARNNMTFRPHRTSFQIDKESRVDLVQEIPFRWGFQPTLRNQVIEFSQLAKRCHQMLMEIAAEEKFAGLLEG